MAEKVITPFPKPAVPDPKEYQHLTHKQRLLAGYPYHNGDEELTRERTEARKLTRKFNNTQPEEREIRKEILKDLLSPSCRGNKVFIIPPFHVDFGYNIVAGNNVELNFGCVILDCAKVTIGDNCLMAPNVQIYAAHHPLDPKHRKDDENYYELATPVTIGKNVWIGGQAVICPGVTIGDNSVIGAGSIVIRDVPANVVVAGNPARIIRHFEVKSDAEREFL